jgi:hypothetical protein
LELLASKKWLQSFINRPGIGSAPTILRKLKIFLRSILNAMHEEILTKNQLELLSLIRVFNRSFYLVGGTAIALYLGHRQSIDFDLFNLNAMVHN